MFGSLAVLVGLVAVTFTSYGIGQLHGYDRWDKENEAFQNGLKEGKKNGI